jgi:Cytochrome c7 and related cytochrome c/Cytochrome c554 and c-prime
MLRTEVVIRIGCHPEGRTYVVPVTMTKIVVGVFGLTFGLAAPTSGQVYHNKCAECHVVMPQAPAPEHVVDWSVSAHGRKGVGCEKCHAGDPNTLDRVKAHAGVLKVTDPASPVHFQNVPATCATCHAGPFAAFQRSQHHAQLAKGDRRVPVCSTCHTTVGGRLLSPTQLEKQCRTCHDDPAVAGKEDRGASMRLLYQSLHQSRDLLRLIEFRIADARDQASRERLRDVYAQADGLLLEAVEAAHQFDHEELETRVAAARQQVETLLEQLDTLKRR